MKSTLINAIPPIEIDEELIWYLFTLHCLSPQAGKTLSARRWHASFSPDGHLDIAKVLRRIQRGVILIYMYTD